MLDNSGLCHCKGIDVIMSSFYYRDLSSAEGVKGFRAMWSIWNYYIPILLLDEEDFEKKNLARLGKIWVTIKIMRFLRNSRM